MALIALRTKSICWSAQRRVSFHGLSRPGNPIVLSHWLLVYGCLGRSSAWSRQGCHNSRGLQWFSHAGVCLSRETWCVFQRNFIGWYPQWVLRTEKLRSPSVENPELTNVLPLTSGVGEDVAMRALPSAGTVFLVLISTSRSTYLHFVHTLSLVKCVSGVGLRNRNRSACSSLQPIDAGSRVECPWGVNRLRNMYDCVS